MYLQSLKKHKDIYKAAKI